LRAITQRELKRLGEADPPDLFGRRFGDDNVPALERSSARRKTVRAWPCEVDAPPPGAETA
jgi:hypothetical protein